MEVSQKIKKKKLLCDPPVYFLGIYPKTMEILNQKYTHIPMFIAALFAISKIWKQFKSQYMYEWIKRMWVYIYIHNGILLNHKKAYRLDYGRIFGSVGIYKL